MNSNREVFNQKFNVKKSSFHPLSTLKDKSNYKPYLVINRDGSIYERILLNIIDMQERERVICLHYLRNYVKIFQNRGTGFNILSRDKPWDFKIELDTSEIFNIEITSIAEDNEIFRKMKSEERLISQIHLEEIPLHEVIKMNTLFPIKEIDKIIDEYLKKGINKRNLVKNPYLGYNSQIFLSEHNNQKPLLSDLITQSIKSKEGKNHTEKEQTVLIIDNRTIRYEYSDLQQAGDMIQSVSNSASFREIWFYTGYCSDLDGNNAEFSLVPLKITIEQNKMLNKFSLKNPPNENGLTVW